MMVDDIYVCIFFVSMICIYTLCVDDMKYTYSQQEVRYYIEKYT